jgi:phospholipid/cholesterol/gamma-HCH transport system permease protein
MPEKKIINIDGDLNRESGRILFDRVKSEIAPGISSIIFDFKDVSKIDSLGGAWLLRIRQMLSQHDVHMEFNSAKGDVAEYLDFIKPGFDTINLKAPPKTNFFEQIGDVYFKGVLEFRQAMKLFVDVIYWTFIAPFDGRGFRWASLMDELHEIGVRAIGIVVLINYLMGFIIAMLSAAQVRKFGAGIYVADLVSIGFARELGPIMTAIIISARSGAAISAELGTMKVQEEIDALKGMGFNVSYFLVAPKVMAMLIALPCLTLLAMAAGVWGGTHVGIFILGLDSSMWLRETFAAVQVTDIFQGLIKSLVFAIIIVFIGCHNGLRVTGGARGVGLVTTRSVVMDIFLIIAFDVIFATLFYYTF